MSDQSQYNFDEGRKAIITDNLLKSYGIDQSIEKSQENITIPKKEFIDEHEKLVDVLNSPSHTDDKEEAEDQEKELKQVTKSNQDTLEKGGKRAVIGEKREFSGRMYIKTADGWKFFGKGTGTKAQGHHESSNSKSESKVEDKNNPFGFDSKEQYDSYIQGLASHSVKFGLTKDDYWTSIDNKEIAEKIKTHSRSATPTNEFKKIQADVTAAKKKMNEVKSVAQSAGISQKEFDKLHPGTKKELENNTKKQAPGHIDSVKYQEEVREKHTPKEDKKQSFSDLENVKEDLKDKFKGYKFKESDNTYGGKTISFSKNDRNEDSSFDIQQKTEKGFFVNMITKKVVSSTSLADPSKNYQTTSARSVRHKTIKTSNHVDTMKDVYKLIDRHLSKINK